MDSITIERGRIGRYERPFLSFTVIRGALACRFAVACSLVTAPKLFELIGSALNVMEEACRPH